MKRTVIALALAAACAVPAFAADPAPTAIEAAQARIAQQPQTVDGYVALAMAYAEHGRDTANTDFYKKAHKALGHALEQAPDNFQALRARTWVLLGQHEFGEALKLATTLNARFPDDIMTYGLLVDANIELGNYDAAERATQWMLDLRPGNVAALTRAAYLRELFGDVEGSLDLMNRALERAPASQSGHRAWLMTHVAHLHRLAGRPAVATEFADQALAILPEYHYALHQQALIAESAGDTQAALAWTQRHYTAAPHPENLYLLGRALERTGQHAAAQSAYQDFERLALIESAGWDNANRELVRYYTDQARHPEAALRVAEREIARRKDILTLDAYAWALYRNGRHVEALETIEQALAVGTLAPDLHYHAGLIAAAAGDSVLAVRYLEQALRLAPQHELAGEARRASNATATTKANARPAA